MALLCILAKSNFCGCSIHQKIALPTSTCHYTTSGHPGKWALENPNVLGVCYISGIFLWGFLGPEFGDTKVYVKCAVAIYTLKMAVVQHQRTTDVEFLLYTRVKGRYSAMYWGTGKSKLAHKSIDNLFFGGAFLATGRVQAQIGLRCALLGLAARAVLMTFLP